MEKLIDKKTGIALIIGVLLSFLTYPLYHLGYDAGIDPPLKWVFNYFATEGFEHANDLNFPHGPLAFLLYPLKSTVLITAVVTLLLKTSLVLLISKLFKEVCFIRWVQIIVSCYAIFVIGNIQQLIIANVIVSYLAYYKNENAWFKLFAFLLTTFAFYIKSYVAILTGITSIFFLFHYLWKRKNLFEFAFDASILLLLISSIWVFLFNSIEGILDYFVGMLQLAQDNSSAAAYYPPNDWVYLSLFLIIVGIIPFILKSKRALFFGLLVVPTIFGAWKHGMAREDIYHVQQLFSYTIVVYLIFLIWERTKRLRNITLLLIGLYLFSLNSTNAVLYQDPVYDWIGLDNIQIGHGNEDMMMPESLTNNLLPKVFSDEIQDQTTDVYPWDYSIIGVNHLKWQPRPVLHSYAAYTPWLDKRNADHFNSKKKPKFLIWEMNSIASDLNGSSFSSIDNRFLLNNEPQTIIEIIRNYKGINRDDKFLILQNRKVPLQASRKILSTTTSELFKWVKTPSHKGILRANVKFNKSITQKLKSFFYKDEQFWIEMKLTSGLKHKYRIVPKNAANGLWVGPYFPNANFEVDEVNEIRLICSNERIMDKAITIDWEQIQFPKETIAQFFQLEDKSINTVEKQSHDYSTLKTKQLSTDQIYCSTVEFDLDSLENGHYRLWIQAEYQSQNYNNTSQKLITQIDVENSDGIWNGINFQDQIIAHNEWNTIISNFEFDKTTASKLIKAYLHNPDKQFIHIKHFEVFLQKME